MTEKLYDAMLTIKSGGDRPGRKPSLTRGSVPPELGEATQGAALVRVYYDGEMIGPAKVNLDSNVSSGYLFLMGTTVPPHWPLVDWHLQVKFDYVLLLEDVVSPELEPAPGVSVEVPITQEKSGVVITFLSPQECRQVALEKWGANGNICEICLGPCAKASLEACHIIPREIGGLDMRNNIVPGHRACNRRQGTRHLYEVAREIAYEDWMRRNR